MYNRKSFSDIENNSIVGKYGTIYRHYEFQIPVKVISKDRDLLHCQGLDDLKHYVVKEDYFYTRGHRYSSKLLTSHLAFYRQIPREERLESYNQSVINWLSAK